ncbi:dynamin family protein [Janibacter cremeus]|uniref:dynamin family protein n=1 Tax=Janibacter cremeus TaxID=1285192 RepID=UPI0023FA30E9|nr:dynamin family protein [Janibacter cremeus]WEV78369.1 dynamin family protein [Janibacter cremeus]
MSTRAEGSRLRAKHVLHAAVTAYAGHEAAQQLLQAQLARLDEPLRIALAGKVKAGKSTLLNALIGEEVAPTDAGECTTVTTWYRHGPAPSSRLVRRDGEVVDLPLVRRHGRLQHTLLGLAPGDVARLEVEWPSPMLEQVTLVDTPGIGSVTTEVSRHTTQLLSAEAAERPVDAVIHLFKSRHADDLAMLRELRGGGVVDAAHAVATTVGVLSRADEVGGGRLDSLISAKDIAARHAQDPQMRALCSDVLPVAGLLAQGGRTLRQDDFDLIAALARMERADREAVLVSVERFSSADAVGGTRETREALVARLGLFGVRLGTVLVRQGIARPGELADELTRRSGLGMVERVIATQFAPRAAALSSLGAVTVLERLLRREPVPQAASLLSECEALRAAENAPEEMRLLAEVRQGAVPGLDARATTAALRLLGDQGVQPWQRLGLRTGASSDDVARAATESLGRWRRLAADPMSREPTRRAARVLARTCEELLDGLPVLTDDGSPAAT